MSRRAAALLIVSTGVACFIMGVPMFVSGLKLGLEPDLAHRLAPISASHWLGTDEAGRDLIGRLLMGAQTSLLVGIGSAILSTLLGTFLGMVAALRGGWLDALIMRVTDGAMALPILPVLIAIAAVDLGKLGIPEALIHHPVLQMVRMILLLALFGWTGVARLTRLASAQILKQDYIRAAYALGITPTALWWHHMVPNVLNVVIVAASLATGQAILIESTLSFLGLGVQPPTSSWGNMLAAAQDQIWTAPQLAFYPGLLIFFVVMGFNLAGDALLQAHDPRRR